MRWLTVAVIAAIASLQANAADAPIVSTPVAVESILPNAEAGVVVTPIPMHGAVVEMTPLSPKPKLRPIKRTNLAKKQSFPSLLLSRTERHRLALLTTGDKLGIPGKHKFFEDENGESGFDELVLHRFFNRPKLASEPDQDQEDESAPEISDEVRLRLFLARMKALEAHALAQIQDKGDDLPDRITTRLKQARQMAVAAHAIGLLRN